jgi:hypothetical protein
MLKPVQELKGRDKRTVKDQGCCAGSGSPATARPVNHGRSVWAEEAHDAGRNDVEAETDIHNEVKIRNLDWREGRAMNSEFGIKMERGIDIVWVNTKTMKNVAWVGDGAQLLPRHEDRPRRKLFSI